MALPFTSASAPAPSPRDNSPAIPPRPRRRQTCDAEDALRKRYGKEVLDHGGEGVGDQEGEADCIISEQ